MGRRSPMLAGVDARLLQDVLSGLTYLTMDPGDWWYAEDCYRDLRMKSWTRVLDLRDKIAAHLESDSADLPLALSQPEIDLSADAVQCAHILYREESATTGDLIGKVFGVVGAAGGMIALISLVY